MKPDLRELVPPTEEKNGELRELGVPARRILVRGVNWLGDAVMTLPALQRLRERFPEAQIALLTHEKLADLWKACPSVSSALTFAAGEGLWRIGRQLRTRDFDTALVLPNSPRSAVEVWLGGIPRRIGYARPWRNSFLTTAVPERPGRVRMHKRSATEIRRLIRGTVEGVTSNASLGQAQAHQLHDYLFLAARLGASRELAAPKLEIPAEDVETATSELAARVGVPLPSTFLGMNPSAAYGPAKRWPAQNFAAAAREISRRIKDAVWLIFGGAADRHLCAEIAALAEVRFLNLAGQTSLRELMRFLSVCRVLLTNDSGPMHLAAALRTPVVVPFGSTSPQLTGPGLPGDPRHHLLSLNAPCAPCFRRTCPIDFRCMTGISVEQVVTAVTSAAVEVAKL